MAQSSSELHSEREDVIHSSPRGPSPLPNDTTPPPDVESGGCCHDTDPEDSGRNLVLCVDGTSNQFGEKNTNVIELYNLVSKKDKDKQKTWYNSGIGTYARPSWKSITYYRQVFHHTVDLAVAWDFERTVMAAYRWLSDVYETGDRIFLFGFSRGAFQVRVLSAMIHKVGLIHKGNELQIPFAYELYADPKSGKENVVGVGSTNEMSSAERFKKAFSRENVKVHFVGAWDTVSSIGIARGTHMLPGTVDGMGHVCFFRHALALDERRVKFLPEFAYGGSTMFPPKPTKSPSKWKFWLPARHTGIRDKEPETKQDSDNPHTLEIWFAGTHSDIGGGNEENTRLDRNRPPLRWMMLEAVDAGLRITSFGRGHSRKEQIEIKESLTWRWWFLELLPFTRLTYTARENGNSNTCKPHLGSPRKIHKGQKIHSSFFQVDRLSNGQLYTPKAHPPKGEDNFWENARVNKPENWLVQDLYDYVDGLVARFIEAIHLNNTVDNSILKKLRKIKGADGQQAVCDGLCNGIIKTMKAPDSDYALDKKLKLLKSTEDILSEMPDKLKQEHIFEIHQVIRISLRTASSVDRLIAETFVIKCTTRPMILDQHAGPVTPVAISSDGKYLASGSRDKILRIWNLETGVGKSYDGARETDW